MRTNRIIPIVPLVLAAAVGLSGAGASGADRSLAELGRQVAELRRELALARLELSRTMQQIEDLRDFLATVDAEAQVEQWQREREELTAERRDLADRRKRIEEARAEVRADLHLLPPPDPDRPKWDLDYRIAAVPLDAGAAPVFIQPIVGRLLLLRFPDADRRSVLVRGTMRNRSAAAWRYTFEVRVADRSDRVIGRWRYQTPRLEPDDLHEFEVKVPVTDVGQVWKYQIGNIEADQGGHER